MHILVKRVLLISALILSGAALADAVDLSVKNHRGGSVVKMVNTTDKTLTVALDITDCANIKPDSCGSNLLTGKLGPRGGYMSISIDAEEPSRSFSFNTRVNTRYFRVRKNIPQSRPLRNQHLSYTMIFCCSKPPRTDAGQKMTSDISRHTLFLP